jgi:hypothetical protein
MDLIRVFITTFLPLFLVFFVFVVHKNPESKRDNTKSHCDLPTSDDNVGVGRQWREVEVCGRCDTLVGY